MLLTLLGSVLLASAFTPSGQIPPPHSILSKVIWFLKSHKAVPVLFNQPLFYIGLLLLLVGILMGYVPG